MIRIKNLTRRFSKDGTALSVFESFSTTCRSFETTVFVGPSGCGKTTFLNLIAGLDKQDSGKILFESGARPQIGYMMQDPLLLPWRSLFENAMLGTEIVRNITSKEQSYLVEQYFRDFDLFSQRNVYPNASSAGMKQRVALIRTLVLKPALLLLDEPFSNLDFDIKLKIQRYLIRFTHAAKATVLLVTHDIEDAIALADRIIVLSEKPTKVKADIPIDLGILKKDPVEARKSRKFREYFIQIWDELKYLDDNE